MARFVRSRSLERDLARQRELKRATVEVAEEIAEKARALAPFRRIAEQIDVATTDDGARVDAHDWISHFWEFGTINHEARPFLRPAAESSAGFGD